MQGQKRAKDKETTNKLKQIHAKTVHIINQYFQELEKDLLDTLVKEKSNFRTGTCEILTRSKREILINQ